MLVDTPSPLPHFSFETPPRAAPPFGRDLRLAGLAQTMPLTVCRCAEGAVRSDYNAETRVFLRDIADPTLRVCAGRGVSDSQKDVKNRGNELNKSFRISKTSKKTNSKRTHLEARNYAVGEPESFNLAGWRRRCSSMSAMRRKCSSVRSCFCAWPGPSGHRRHETLPGLRQPRRYGNRRNKARMSMKTKDRSRNQPPPGPSLSKEGNSRAPLLG